MQVWSNTKPKPEQNPKKYYIILEQSLTKLDNRFFHFEFRVGKNLALMFCHCDHFGVKITAQMKAFRIYLTTFETIFRE